MKRFLCLLLSLATVLSLSFIPGGVLAAGTEPGYQPPESQAVPSDAVNLETLTENVATDDAGYSHGFSYTAYGENNVYYIDSAAGLKLFSNMVNSSTSGSFNVRFQGKTVYLANDIDMKGVTDFAPIGNDTGNDLNGTGGYPCFRGTFNGLGYRIKNLHMTSSADGNVNVALFGVIGNAKIINLVLDETCSFTYTGSSVNARVGAIAGRILVTAGDTFDFNDSTGKTVGCTIQNVQNNATVASGSFAGGIVGSTRVATNASILIQNVSNCGAVEGKTYAAGIIGYMQGRYATLKACVNTGNITSEGNAAGLLNESYEGDNRSLVIDTCYVSGTIKGASMDALVLAGRINTGYLSISGCNISGVTLARNGSVGYRYTEGTVPQSAVSITEVVSKSDATEFRIDTPSDLKFFADYVNRNQGVTDVKACMYGKTVYLAEDLDLSEITDMAPIGSGGNYFSGTFNGMGHTIRNLVIDASDTSGNVYIGLFGLVKGACIKNVVLGDGCSFVYQGDSTEAYVGAVVGKAIRAGFGQADRNLLTGNTSANIHDAFSTVQNCYSSATVISNGYAAGIVGYASGNTNAIPGTNVWGCTNAGEVSAKQFAAGIVGGTDRGIAVVSCRNAGTVTLAEGSASGAGAAGILADYNVANDKNATVSSCINNGEIKGSGILGGIVAKKSGHKSGIAGCTNYGKLTATLSEATVGEICAVDQEASSATEIHGNALKQGTRDSSWTDVHFVGFQIRKGENGTYDVRLLATLNDLSSFNSVGFQIVASYGEKTSAPVTRITDTVFENVQFTGEDGVDTLYASSYGGAYFVALTVLGVSDSYGNVTFRVQTVQDEAVSETVWTFVLNSGKLISA